MTLRIRKATAYAVTDDAVMGVTLRKAIAYAVMDDSHSVVVGKAVAYAVLEDATEVVIAPASVGAAAVFGMPAIETTVPAQVIDPAGLVSESTIGLPVLDPGIPPAQVIDPAGLVSESTIGLPALDLGIPPAQGIDPAGLVSESTIGLPALDLGIAPAQSLALNGMAETTFGSLAVTVGEAQEQVLTLVGLSATSDFGAPLMARGVRPCPPGGPHLLRQGIHPYTIICGHPEGIYTLTNGGCIIFPLDIEPGQVWSLAGLHLSSMQPPPSGLPTAQDWTLRVWVSSTILGPHEGAGGLPTGSWRPQSTTRVLWLQDRAVAAPATPEWLGFQPGAYWLHILNLANTGNSMQISLTGWLGVA